MGRLGFEIKRRPRRRAAIVFAAGLTVALGSSFLLIVIEACSSSSALVGPGGECFLATDCAPGLVCLEQPNKTRVCSDDLRGVAGRAPPDGAAVTDDAGDGGTTDGAPDAAISPPRDAGGAETGSPADTGAPPMDAAADG